MARTILFPLFGVFVTDVIRFGSTKEKKKEQTHLEIQQAKLWIARMFINGLMFYKLGFPEEEYEKYLGQSRKESWVCVQWRWA